MGASALAVWIGPPAGSRPRTTRSAAVSGAAVQALARLRAFCYSLPTIGSPAGGVALQPAIGHRSLQRRYGGDAKVPGKRL